MKTPAGKITKTLTGMNAEIYSRSINQQPVHTETLTWCVARQSIKKH